MLSLSVRIQDANDRMTFQTYVHVHLMYIAILPYIHGCVTRTSRYTYLFVMYVEISFQLNRHQYIHVHWIVPEKQV